MATDIGGVTIGLEPDEPETIRVYDKAGKVAAARFVQQMDRGIRRLVSNAAAAFGGAQGRGASNLVLAGIPPLGGAARGVGGRAAGAAAAIGPAGFAAIGAVVLVTAIGLAVRALNKNTMAQARSLSSVSPVLARVQAEGNIQELRQRMVTARLFESSIASTARTLQQAKGELFKAKLGLTAVKVVFSDIASKISLGAAKALSFLIVDLPLAYTKLLNSIKIGVFTLLAGLADFLIPGAAGEGLAAVLRMQVQLLEAQNAMIKKIAKAIDDLAAQSGATAVNDQMLLEIRRMAGLPMNPHNFRGLPGFDPSRPSGQTSQGVPVIPGQ